ncbi:putative methyltransferase-domain-containing protein [Colletotrichum cereale]|nr:putative methyltransferase-domain-containing protein [Colletotrichum cereale]
MESADRSPSPDFSPLAIGEDLTPLPAYKAAQTSSYDICGLLSTPLKLHEDLTSGCGGQTWPAGMVLTKHMLRYHREALKGAKILELGAGGGLVGLAVALGCELQQTPLYLTDQDEMFELMGKNTELNNLQHKVKPMVLNWGGPLAKEVVDFKPNVILAADCVYFEPAFPLLLETLTNLLSLEPNATVYFCFKKRRRADMQFLKKAQKAFQVTEIVDDDRAIFSRAGLFLYTFTSKKPMPNGNRE